MAWTKSTLPRVCNSYKAVLPSDSVKYVIQCHYTSLISDHSWWISFALLKLVHISTQNRASRHIMAHSYAKMWTLKYMRNALHRNTTRCHTGIKQYSISAELTVLSCRVQLRNATQTVASRYEPTFRKQPNLVSRTRLHSVYTWCQSYVNNEVTLSDGSAALYKGLQRFILLLMCIRWLTFASFWLGLGCHIWILQR